MSVSFRLHRQEFKLNSDRLIGSCMRKKAIIIGAGPVGLSAAYQLLTRTDIIPIVLEQSGTIDGSSASYKVSKMDFGLHTSFLRLIRLFFCTQNISYFLRAAGSSNRREGRNGILASVSVYYLFCCPGSLFDTRDRFTHRGAEFVLR